jgi:hypothetical protein
MNILKGNILKGFATIAMLCMIGAMFATPVAMGDIGAGYVLYESSKVQDKPSYIITAGVVEATVVGALLPFVISSAAIGGPVGLGIGAAILV